MTSEFANALNSIPAEHLTARKATRLKFMRTESEQQRLYLEDLETSLALNKSMLQELFQVGASHEDTQTLTFASPRIIEQLISENRRLEDQLHKAMEVRNEAQGKALINEQILAECHLREQELIEEFEEKLQELKYQSERKDRLVQELSLRNQHLESEAELYQKSKDIVILPPIEPVLLLHEKVERLRTHMHKVARELHRTRSHKELLVDECRNLWSDYNKANALLKNPVNRRLGTPRNKELSFGDL
jgi:chromosome segregation ATPase